MKNVSICNKKTAQTFHKITYIIFVMQICGLVKYVNTLDYRAAGLNEN